MTAGGTLAAGTKEIEKSRNADKKTEHKQHNRSIPPYASVANCLG
jgi:hypothetical protein